VTLSLAVLISGTGSNLNAILSAIDSGRCDAVVGAVISDRSSAKGLELAATRGIPTAIVKLSEHADRDAWDAALAERVRAFAPQLVVLAGFMKIVGKHMLAAFDRRMVNVHPALLPAFAGSDGPAQALAAGVRISGCTVHLVDGGLDSGPIIAQAAVPVLDGDDVATLHARIQRAEHRLLPSVIDGVARGTIVLGRAPASAPAAASATTTASLFSPAIDPVS
jgi:phosphoribosylglycinamide formyltransferase-1